MLVYPAAFSTPALSSVGVPDYVVPLHLVTPAAYRNPFSLPGVETLIALRSPPHVPRLVVSVIVDPVKTPKSSPSGGFTFIGPLPHVRNELPEVVHPLLANVDTSSAVICVPGVGLSSTPTHHVIIDQIKWM